MAWRGKPETIRVDHGPEFIAHHFKDGAKQRGMTMGDIPPGKPTLEYLDGTIPWIHAKRGMGYQSIRIAR